MGAQEFAMARGGSVTLQKAAQIFEYDKSVKSTVVRTRIRMMVMEEILHYSLGLCDRESVGRGKKMKTHKIPNPKIPTSANLVPIDICNFQTNRIGNAMIITSVIRLKAPMVENATF